MVKKARELLTETKGRGRVGLIVAVGLAAVALALLGLFVQQWQFGGSTPGYGREFLPTRTPTELPRTPTITNTPTITDTPTITNTPTATLTPTSTPTFIPKLEGSGPPKAIIGGGTGGVGLGGFSSLSRYVPMFNTGVAFVEGDVQQAMPSDGTVTHFFVHLDGPSGVSGSYNFIVRRSGSDTTVTCTNTGGIADCSDRSNCAHFSAGDFISIKFIGKGSPSSRAMQWTAIFTGNATCPLPPP